jgi:hypothetical protein
MSVHVGFLVEKAAQEADFLKVLRIRLPIPILSNPQVLSYNRHFPVYSQLRNFKESSLEESEVLTVVNVTELIVQDTLRRLVWYTNTNVSDLLCLHFQE